MANALYLKRFMTTVSLLTGTLKLRMGTWNMRAPEPVGEWKEWPLGATYKFKNYPRITETFDLVGKDTAANLRTGIKAIEDMLEGARMYTAEPFRSTTDAVYLVAQSEGESERLAIVYSGALRFSGIGGSSPLLDGTAINAQLVLQRHPLWENTLYTEYGDDVTGINLLGGILRPVSSAKGTAPGRLDYISATPLASTVVTKLWLGIRSFGAGWDYFKSLWECETGTINDTTYTTLAGETGASPSGSTNNKLLVTYNAADTANTKRYTIVVKQLGVADAYLSDFYGRYMVLLRAKVPSSTNVVFQLRYGYNGSSDAQFRIAGQTYYAGTGANWRLIELGEVTIPPTFPPAGATEARNTALQLWLQRVSGTGNVDLDALVLIPSTHCLRVTDMGDMGATGKLEIRGNEDESVNVLEYLVDGGSYVYKAVPSGATSWNYPTDGGMVVVAGERASSHVLTDTVAIKIRDHPRWLSYRTA